MKRYKRAICANSNATIYQIPTKWEVQATIPVPARSLKEAIDIVSRQDCDIPSGHLAENSFKVDYDSLEE